MIALVRRHGDRLALLAMLLAIATLHVVAFGNRWIADDAWFARALDGTTLTDFLAFRYSHWSGRLPIETVLVWMVWHPWAWKLANAAMWLLFCHAAGRIAFAGTTVAPARSTVFAFLAFLLLSPDVLFSAAWWTTGSINYLWPMALGLYGLRAFVAPASDAPARRFAMLLAAGLAMYNEQVAIALLPACALLWWMRRTVPTGRAWDLAQLLFMAANAAVVFGAPGSRARYLSEQSLWFPDFAFLDPMHKAAIGLGLVYDGLFDPTNLLVFALLGMVTVLVLASPAGRGAKAAVIAMLAFLLLGYLQAVPGLDAASGLRSLYDVPPPDGSTASSSRAYALSALAAFAVACVVGGAVLACWRSRVEAGAVAVALLLGLASLAALGFSPTAYASGWRIHFVCQAALLLVALRLGWRCREEFGPRTAGVLVAVAAPLAAWRVLALLGWT